MSSAAGPSRPPNDPQKSKPKVVRIIGRLNVGGPARQACLLHEALRQEFATVLVTGTVDAGEADMSYLLHSEEGVERISALSRPVRLASDFVSLWKIYRILRRERPDIVHTHTAKAGTLGRIAAIFAGVKVRVHTFHGHIFSGYFTPLKTRMYLAIERWLARHTTRIVTVSFGQAEELSGRFRIAPRARFQVITNGFDWTPAASAARERIRTDLGIPPDAFLVLWCGRMAPIKGTELLADIIRAAASDPKIFFAVVGDGSEREVFEAAVGGTSNLRRLGWREDIAALLAASDAALLTSINEGTPTALVEAMFAGKPWVATDVGGVPDLAGATLDESTLAEAAGAKRCAHGFVAPRRADALLHCLQRLAADDKLCEAMAESGKDFARARFASTRLVKEMATLYQTLLSEDRPERSPTSSAAAGS